MRGRRSEGEGGRGPGRSLVWLLIGFLTIVGGLIGCQNGRLARIDASTLNADAGGGREAGSDGSFTADAAADGDVRVRPAGPCDGVDCSGHGRCRVGPNDSPVCDCDDGYRLVGLRCRPTAGADVGAQADAGQPADAGRPDARDAGPDGCGGRTCGTNASCQGGMCRCDSAFIGDPHVRCELPMQGSCTSRGDCGTFAVCIAGTCECEPGFSPMAGGSDCKRPTVADPVTRTKQEVCRYWNQATAGRSRFEWARAPTGKCDPGEMKPKVHWDAVHATNAYRWIVGLDPVASDPAAMKTNQACATTLAANGSLSHRPPSSWACYTREAASGAGSSNLVAGSSHPAGSVRRYIKDRGNYSTMGHRRWIFNPGMGKTAFGHRGGFGCMYAFDRSGRDSQTVIRYPSAGPFPYAGLTGPWNYFETRRTDMDGAKVTVTDVASGTKLAVRDVSEPVNRYGRIYGLVWRVSGAKSGRKYRVRISNIGSTGSRTVTYVTELVSCP